MRYYKTYLTINSIIDSTLSTYFGFLCHSTQVQCVEYLCKFLANNKMDMFKTAGSKTGMMLLQPTFYHLILLIWSASQRSFISTDLGIFCFLPFYYKKSGSLTSKACHLDIRIKFVLKSLHINRLKRRKVGWSGIIPSLFLAIANICFTHGMSRNMRHSEPMELKG